jgi:hypothetical protein
VQQCKANEARRLRWAWACDGGQGTHELEVELLHCQSALLCRTLLRFLQLFTESLEDLFLCLPWTDNIVSGARIAEARGGGREREGGRQR